MLSSAQDPLSELLAQRWVFHCCICPLGANDRGQTPAEAYPAHRLNPPLTDASAWPRGASMQLRSINERFDGATLFAADYLHPTSGRWESYVVRLLPADELETETARFRQTVPNAADSPWVQQLVVFALMSSGDVLLADPSLGDAVCRVDHEIYYGGSLGEGAMEIVAATPEAFLNRLLSDPTPFLDSWRHLDATGEQYYVARAEILEQT